MKIRADRLAGRLDALAQIGATPQGGVTRLALTAEDSAARAMLLQWCAARGFAWRRDAIGNLFIRREGRRDAPPIQTGSHLDTQRNGGNFDGIYGVLAGLEVLESLSDASVTTEHPFEVVVWTNEEGVRFPPVTMGSSVHGGQLQLEEVLKHIDADGQTVAQALVDDSAWLPAPTGDSADNGFAAYVELHIEQGPVLEARDVEIGIVTGIQGTRQFSVHVPGRAAHAGTTPAAERDDAFLKALALHEALRLLSEPGDANVRFTVGRFVVAPGTPNTVPGSVDFTIDLRHPDPEVLSERGDAMLKAAEDRHFDGCVIQQMIHSPPVSFDEQVCSAIAAAARDRNLSAMRILSGATHDARNIAHLGPTGMIFVPSRDGISHNPAEWTSPEQIAAGCEILADTLLALDRR